VGTHVSAEQRLNLLVSLKYQKTTIPSLIVSEQTVFTAIILKLTWTTSYSVAGQFNKSWRHSGTCPPVQAIYKIVNTEASMQVYEAYR
jgi:hypothetical protein